MVTGHETAQSVESNPPRLMDMPVMCLCQQCVATKARAYGLTTVEAETAIEMGLI